MFTKSERREVVISDVALVVVLCGLAALGHTYGFAW